MAIKDLGVRTINERHGQFSLTLPKKAMVGNNYQNKEKVRVTMDSRTGEIVLRRLEKLIEE